MSNTSPASSYEVITEKLKSTVGPDWNSPRARVYIAAELDMYMKAAAKLSEELKWEREVNRRVLEVFKAGFGIKTDA